MQLDCATAKLEVNCRNNLRIWIKKVKTTFKKIWAASPPRDIWVKLLKHIYILVKLLKHIDINTYINDEPITILEILDAIGFDGAYWCLQTVEGYDEEISQYKEWCDRGRQPLLDTALQINISDVFALLAQEESELIRLCEECEGENK